MKKIVLFLTLVILFTLTSCAQAQNPPVKGKFVFYSLRDPKVGWAAYLLKDGKMMLLGKKLTSPVFSPDGKTIAATTGNGIVLLDEDGHQKDLIDLGKRPAKLRWSPDGKKILYSIRIKEERKGILRELDLLTNEDKLFLDFGQGTHFGGIVYSPDGSQVMVCIDHPDPEKIGIYILNSDGTNLRHINKHGLSQIWLPDGKHIIYETNRDEQGHQINKKFGSFFRMDLETGKVTKLQDVEILTLAFPKISKDGKYYYLSKPYGQDGQRIVLWPVEDFKKEISVTECVSLSQGTGLSQDLDPDWHQGD